MDLRDKMFEPTCPAAAANAPRATATATKIQGAQKAHDMGRRREAAGVRGAQRLHGWRAVIFQNGSLRQC
eukprot:6310681-Pyramimonas_sp.AAC.1